MLELTEDRYSRTVSLLQRVDAFIGEWEVVKVREGV